MDIFLNALDDQVICSFIDEMNDCITTLTLPSGKSRRSMHDADYLRIARRFDANIKSAKLVFATDDWSRYDCRYVADQTTQILLDSLKSGAAAIGNSIIEAHAAAVAICYELAKIKPGPRASVEFWKMITSARAVVARHRSDAEEADRSPIWNGKSTYDIRANWSF
jgi:hypothetical protein